MSDLSDIKEQIEKELPSVYIDITRDSVFSAIACYPEIFGYNGTEILRKDTADEFFEEPVMDYFAIGIDKTLRKQLVEKVSNIKLQNI